MAIQRCPICSGPLGDWEIRSEFSCPHCDWALSANLRQASAWAFAVAVIAELVGVAGLWLWADSAADALDYCVAVFGAAGTLAWGVVYHFRLCLKPIRPQRHRRAGRFIAPAADRA